MIVLGLGMERRLGVAPETLVLLREAGAEVHVEETRAAVGLYNALAAARRVGGLFHSTC
ncbi:MTH938/NDUFAF3 family protein [Streptomyces sp. NBC_00249]|uniref:MTH938/NDUFAF3 family protein n=1 Tax=Streptomyces sp. NBC_00249 TaxID=2975690 RepID=UPI00224F4E84|nr:MTH938/NDUFAF3 family protein [Streptomyces sp. NBC_00249]MCX5196027.1 MTH938/NDUFAF3 family protein [Streptomyces sp. NBC_00249]